MNNLPDSSTQSQHTYIQIKLTEGPIVTIYYTSYYTLVAA